jgi:hypothetical protein
MGMIFVQLYFKLNRMKSFLLLLVVIIIGITGCEKAKNTTTDIAEGTYSGTFQRTLPNGDAIVSNVIILFSEEKWSGQSDIPKYPALCNGTYNTNKDIIEFENNCAWTADFDWSLILSGDYKFEQNKDSLIISKSYEAPFEFHDIYRLRLTNTGSKESPMHGTWVEVLHRKDTIVFASEYDGIYPVFNLNRGYRISEGYTLPDYFSGSYWYILGTNSISVNWFLSSNSIYNRFYFNVLPAENTITIGNFFADPTIPPVADTLTFVKIK